MRMPKPQFAPRMKPQGVWASVFRSRFQIACQRFGMNEQRLVLDYGQFLRPNGDGPMLLL